MHQLKRPLKKEDLEGIANFHRIVKNYIKMKRIDERHSYLMGYDCAINGATLTNCSAAIFSCSENTLAWEKGKKRWFDCWSKRFRSYTTWQNNP